MDQQKPEFKALTPINTLDLGVYKDALDFALDSPTIENIAITGKYGSGKSSLIESYKRVKKDKKFLHISLAHFYEKYQATHTNETDIHLESKIINQLLHQIEISNIPKTSFKLIKETKLSNILAIGLSLFLSTLNCIFFGFYKEINLFYTNSLQEIEKIIPFHNITITISIIDFLFLIFISYKFSILFKGKSLLKRFNLNGNEVELFPENNNVLDKHTGDIIYLLKKSNAHAIVFEDIDRFNSTLIFEQLREINRIANSDRNYHSKIDRIKFIYLIKDEIFEFSDRIKFFDFIIPLVPVIISTNSFSILHTYFSSFDKLDEDFLKALSFYLDDIRTIKNIYNEFIIYKKSIDNSIIENNHSHSDTPSINNKKLLSLIIYKNLFPEDFANLQNHKGLLYQLIEIETREKEMYLLQEKEELYKKLHKAAIDVLNRTYTNAFDNLNSIVASIDEVTKLTTNFYHKNLDKNLVMNNIDSIINRLFEGNKENQYYEALSKSDKIGIVSYFISNELIDSTYHEYLSYFYPGYLTINDKNFIKNLYENKSMKFNYRIDSPKRTISETPKHLFQEIRILNIDIIEELFKEDQKQFLEKRDLVRDLIFSIINNPQHNYFREIISFINEYITNSANPIGFILLIFFGQNQSQNNNIFSLISEEAHKRVVLWSLLCIKFEEDTDIKTLKEQLAKAPNLLDFDQKENILINSVISKNSEQKFNILEEAKQKLIDYKIKFNTIDITSKNINLILDNELFEITKENISKISKYLSKESEISDIKNICEIIFSSVKPEFINYIENNISKFISVVIDLSDNSISDAIPTALKILNNKNISYDMKIAYLKKLEKIDDIDPKLISDESIRNHFKYMR